MKLGTLVAAAALLLTQGAWAAFDPVHEDIDIFMMNPALASTRPNVLILLDNTANWNQAFDDEKAALVSLVNGLTEEFNVGIGMYAETGGGNDSEDGAYIRFGVRQMKNTDASPSGVGTAAAPNNRYALATMAGALNNLTDKGNNNTISLAMSEVYAYFKGTTSWSSYGKVKTDYAGNAADNPLAASIGGNAFSAAPTAASLFNSPIIDGCQKNFVIYIGNGKFNENNSAVTASLSRLTAARGSAPSTVVISPNAQQGNWADEWAQFMAQSGFSYTVGGAARTVYVNTYTVAINPSSNSWDAGSLALMQSMATQGKGKYFTATSGDGGSSIIDALNKIFTEIQSVNSVFASTTLPVSVNVRGTNLNQVYIGMFRPNSGKAPRWYGNLKLYQLGLDNLGNLFLADSAGAQAENPSTGFVGSTNTSYWTHSSSFWDWRSSDENGPSGGSDSPDGNLVEKGAVAQRVREAYAASQAARNLFTCTSDCVACTDAACTNGSLLSATPFSTANPLITPAALGLGTKAVSPLTAKRNVGVSSITDRRSVSLNNVSGGSTYVLSALSNGAATRAVSAISTGVTMTISSLSAAVAASALNISNVTVAETSSGSGGSVVWTSTFTVTTAAAHSYASGNSVTIAGNTASGGSDINGSFTVASVPSATTFTFAVAGRNLKKGNNGTVTGPATASSTARATLVNHGLATGQTVTIAGASPSVFNGSFGVTVVDANSFTYSLSSPQGAAATAGTMTKSTTTATVTTGAAHGFGNGNSVTIAGASPAGLNGTFVIANAAGNSFTYTLPAAVANNTAAGVTATKGATTTATATTASTAGLVAGATQVSVTGADICYNGTYTVATVPDATTFTYTLGSACSQNTAGAGMSAVSGGVHGLTVTATLAAHGFAVGDMLAIADGTAALHNGTVSVASVPDADTFTYVNPFVAGVAPSGSYTARFAVSPLAYASAANHGFATGDTVTITGSTTAAETPAGASNAYNGTFTVTRIDDNSFSYPLLAAEGTQTAAAGINAAVNTTTATATSVNHGFASGTTVAIAGASPAAFNGNFVITSTGSNSFQYTLPSAQGDASGTILASVGSGSNSEQTLLINWVRGQDNAENENGVATPTTDCRASVHGDVLHSRPAVINYNRYGGDNDVYVFYGANDGVFRAIKGGTTKDVADPTTLLSGDEAWGFVPTEGFTSLSRLRNNSPLLGSNFKKPYFLDGPIGIYAVDGDGDGTQTPATASDKVYLYIGARRGGRFLYSLDVSNPVAPRYRWKIDNTTVGFGELGYTWSQATVVTGLNSYTNPVLVFGGGYDPNVEDIENCTITSTAAASYVSASNTYTPASVSYSNGTVAYNSVGTGCTVTGGGTTTVSRSMGRAIYFVDAITGAKIWSASYPGSGATLEVPGMDYAISSDVTVVKNISGGYTSRAYVGDNGGNLWRIDFGDANPANWTVTKIAAISDLATAAGRRKFQNPPDVVAETGYDAIVIGSGDREHPFDNTVVNRFYMFRDHGNDAGPGTGTTYASAATTTRAAAANGTGNPLITHGNVAPDGHLYDGTSACAGAACENPAALAAADGWFITLGTGEKTIGNAVALNGVVFFNTNQPSQTADSSCVGNLGIARQYQVGVTDSTGKLDNSARSSVFPGGGYLPPPVHVVVQVTDGTGTLVTKEGVISGTSVQTPTIGAIGNRTRRYWYKEID